MRDAIIIPVSQDGSLVITSDNSGAIGMKELDLVKIPYETVGYYSFRVAVMECIAAGAIPIAVIIQNFCGDDDWSKLVSGVRRGLTELQMEDIQITGSTESNFSLQQSAIGINVIGKRLACIPVSLEDLYNKELALIGLPLVGDEVVTSEDQIAPLSIFRNISNIRDVVVWPVGSKGVLRELKRMLPNLDGDINSSNIDLLKSGGPSTSFLVAYPPDKAKEIRKISGRYFRSIRLRVDE